MSVTRPLTEDVTDLGRRLGDPGLLLTGEEPATGDPGRARYWLEVHRELLRARLDLLDRLERRLARTASRHVAAGLRVNARAVRLAADRSRGRVGFWSNRLRDLMGGAAETAGT